jgi:hypothetical protein
MKEQFKLASLTVSPRFPTLWTPVLDDMIPTFVKQRFSPQNSWKNKPFSQDDVVFFSKGLVELSDFFTEDRESSKLPNYFTTAKFRSSYFLYFFALQGAKFLTLFDRYPQAIEAALEHGKKTGTLTVLDLGSGPGTASLAFLVHVLERYQNEKTLPFKIKLHWVDHNEAILKDGEAFFQSMLESFSKLIPHLHAEMDLVTEKRPWWQHPKNFNPQASLILFGNVLNESANNPKAFHQGLAPLLQAPQGGGVLLVEPALRGAAQRLSKIRDEWVSSQKPGQATLWGPCLHQGACPLSQGRDWCHFSVPAELPGKFFKKFSIKLGSVRDWLKFSFLWIGASESFTTASIAGKGLARIVSNPMKTKFGEGSQICRPEKIEWVSKSALPIRLQRGDVIHYPLQKRSK